ncbi:MAG: ArsA family ATPase [Deltaproteobacteria bacterium]|nr:ArsA family ATPase [Deltaproteobacteria bacterium]MBW1871574.1 ArsA family ATPase [Deltaproteobacteria bacterium]
MGPLFHFFSGKGGVGKTTLAAATAVNLARAGRRVLITSTDPAHSLSDVFDLQIGHAGCEIEPNLQAIEVDSSTRWAEATGAASAPDSAPKKRGRLERALGDALNMLGDAPGVDEFISLELLLETMTSDAYDSVVFDTAPTGHTLRLLLLPKMLDGWIGKMITLRGYFSKFGRTIRKLMPRASRGQEEDIGKNLQGARERVMQARDLIMDAERTLFALVTIPEAMSVLETQRTLELLSTNSIPVGVVIANQVQPESNNCDHCQARRAIHLRELGRLKDLIGQVPLRQVETSSLVIRGSDALAELGGRLWRNP